MKNAQILCIGAYVLKITKLGAMLKTSCLSSTLLTAVTSVHDRN